MELTLTLQADTTIAVACDSHPSHTFDLTTLAPDPHILGRPPQPLVEPALYGQAIYAALFPPGTAARRALDAGPSRILLVAEGDALDAVPWEYAHDTSDFLILDRPFVRGVPAEKRVPPGALDAGLHIVAVPSNPLDDALPALTIDGEWQRLVESIKDVPAALTLERTRPPTLEQLRRLVANQRQRVIHFMGHGWQTEQGTLLCFEQDDGGLATATAREFVRLIRGTAFLVTLNACVSATPGQTAFSNLAAALVRQQVPYALGMRFSVLDEDARQFARTLYGELARGVSVEEAVQQARAALARGPRVWAVGVPVLYTALNTSVSGFTTPPGTPQVIDRRPPIDALAIPRAEGTFQGRVAELRAIARIPSRQPPAARHLPIPRQPLIGPRSLRSRWAKPSAERKLAEETQAHRQLRRPAWSRMRAEGGALCTSILLFSDVIYSARLGMTTAGAAALNHSSCVSSRATDDAGASHARPRQMREPAQSPSWGG